jgi:hypothetical protein
MKDFVESYASGPFPDGPDQQFDRDLGRATERLLENAHFATGLGEPLSEVAGDLVALTNGRAILGDVVRHLQAAAAPASAFIPPASDFAGLAAEIYDFHRRARYARRASS